MSVVEQSLRSRTVDLLRTMANVLEKAKAGNEEVGTVAYLMVPTDNGIILLMPEGTNEDMLVKVLRAFSDKPIQPMTLQQLVEGSEPVAAVVRGSGGPVLS